MVCDMVIARPIDEHSDADALSSARKLDSFSQAIVNFIEAVAGSPGITVAPTFLRVQA